MFVFSFLAVLGCVGAAAWLFLINPKQEKPGILTASVEIGAPIIIESDADPVPTELENAAIASPASSVTETTPEPAEEPVPAAKADPETAPETAKTDEPVQSEDAADTAPADTEQTVAKAAEPISDTPPVEESLAVAPVAEAADEETDVVTQVAPSPAEPVEEETATAEVVDTLPPASEAEEEVSSVPPVSIPEEPIAAVEAPESVEEKTAPVIAAIEEEATDPPAAPQQPNLVEVPLAAVSEVPSVDDTSEMVSEPEIAIVAPEPEATLEQAPSDPTLSAAPSTEVQPEPIAEATDVLNATVKAEVVKSEVATVETETAISEPDASVQATEAPAPLAPSSPAAAIRPEDVAVAATEPFLKQELPETEEPSPIATVSPETTTDTDEAASIETALVIPPAPVENEEIAADPAPEPLVIAVPAALAPPLWKTHARPFEDPQDRPRIALIISEMGVSSVGTAAAIDGLPGAVTLAFNPYGRNLQSWITRARDAGHEVLVQLPMEPVGYPKIDPGPQALLTSLDAAANLERLEWVLGRMDGYVGITNQMGSRFTASKEHIRPVLEVVKEKGLLYLDSRTASNSVGAQVASELSMPVALNNRFLDHKADGDIIDARLAELEEIALKTGSAVGVAYPYSLTLEHISQWAEGLADKNIVLAPVSALVNRQDIK